MRASSVPVLLLTHFLGGCAAVATPQKSAFLTLFEPTGKLNIAAFQAALEARFIPGSQVKLLMNYAHSMDGFGCSAPDADGAVTCDAEIENCAYGWNAKLNVSAGVIQAIKFQVGTVICD
jgi:hypothetical protein